MTTIFYCGKNLYADKRVMHHSYPSRVSDDGIKLFINPENTIALGISGLLPNEAMKKKLFNISSVFFEMMYKGELNQAMTLKDLFGDMPKGLRNDFPHMIGITTNKAFLYKDEEVYPQTGFMAALGTGNRSIFGCYYVVQDIAAAFRLSSEIDTLSSPEYMSVMADSLTPYVME